MDSCANTERIGEPATGIPESIVQELAKVVDQQGSLKIARQRVRARKEPYLYEVYRLVGDEKLLAKFLRHYGGGVYENGTNSYPVWKIVGTQCRKMLRAMLPHLALRREEVRRLLELREAVENNPMEVPQAVLAFEAESSTSKLLRSKVRAATS